MSDRNMQDHNKMLELGNNVTIEPFASVISHLHIKIGDNTMIGPGACVVDCDHYMGPDFERTTEIDVKAEVIIGKNCWLGANSVVLKGVTLGDGCIVGAGAVVTKSFPGGSIIVGNPGRLLRRRI